MAEGRSNLAPRQRSSRTCKQHTRRRRYHGGARVGATCRRSCCNLVRPLLAFGHHVLDNLVPAGSSSACARSVRGTHLDSINDSSGSATPAPPAEASAGAAAAGAGSSGLRHTKRQHCWEKKSLLRESPAKSDLSQRPSTPGRCRGPRLHDSRAPSGRRRVPSSRGICLLGRDGRRLLDSGHDCKAGEGFYGENGARGENCCTRSVRKGRCGRNFQTCKLPPPVACTGDDGLAWTRGGTGVDRKRSQRIMLDSATDPSLVPLAQGPRRARPAPRRTSRRCWTCHTLARERRLAHRLELLLLLLGA